MSRNVTLHNQLKSTLAQLRPGQAFRLAQTAAQTHLEIVKQASVLGLAWQMVILFAGPACQHSKRAHSNQVFSGMAGPIRHV